MAPWSKMAALFKENKITPDNLNYLYDNRGFPALIRMRFPNWIEAHFMQTNANVNIPTMVMDLAEQETVCMDPKVVFASLLALIENEKDEDIRISLAAPSATLKDRFTDNEEEFMKTVRGIMDDEDTFIEASKSLDEDELRRKGQNDEANMTPLMSEHMQLLTQLNQAVVQTPQCDQAIDQATECSQQLTAQLRRQRSQGLTAESTKMLLTFKSHTESALRHLKQMTDCIYNHMQTAWRLISDWKRDCMLKIASLSTMDLLACNRLNEICERIGRLYSTTLDQTLRLIKLLTPSSTQVFNNTQWNEELCTIENNLNTLIELHLQHIFVVEEQPNQVLKYTAGRVPKFAASVIILGGSSLGLKKDPQPSTVCAHLIKYADLQTVMANDIKAVRDKLIVKNCEQQLRDQIKVNQHWMEAWFPNLELVSRNKANKDKDADRVTDIMHVFVFTTMVTLRDKPYSLKVASVPIVIISQTSQDCMARGTLVWHAVFSDPNTVGGADAAEVGEWEQVAYMLNAMFLEHTGRGLDDQQLKYLADIAFNEPNESTLTAEALNTRKISRQQFLKDKVRTAVKGDFSFWKWFVACLNLVRNYVKAEWQKGWIHGFISKEECQRRLRASNEPGTFIIRFCQSELEDSQKTDVDTKLVVAVLTTDPRNPSTNDVFFTKESLAPNDIHGKGLGPLLYAFEVMHPVTNERCQLLHTLYPNRPLEHLHPRPVLQPSSDPNYYRSETKILIYLTGVGESQQSATKKQSSVRKVSPNMPLSPAESGIGSPSSVSNMTSPYPPSVMSPSPPPAVSPAEMMPPPSQVGSDTALISNIIGDEMDELSTIDELIITDFESNISITDDEEKVIQEIMRKLDSNVVNENVAMDPDGSLAISFDTS